MDTCVNCRCDLGVEVKELPFFLPDGDDGKLESWCPQCLVWVRMPQDAERYHASRFVAWKCGRCGFKTADPGRGACGYCNSPTVVLLLPKAEGEAERILKTLHDTAANAPGKKS